MVVTGTIGEPFASYVDARIKQIADPDREDLKNGPNFKFGEKHLDVTFTYKISERPYHNLHPDSDRVVAQFRLLEGKEVYVGRLSKINEDDSAALPQIVERLSTLFNEGLLDQKQSALALHGIAELTRIMDPIKI